MPAAASRNHTSGVPAHGSQPAACISGQPLRAGPHGGAGRRCLFAVPSRRLGASQSQLKNWLQLAAAGTPVILFNNLRTLAY